MSSIIPIAFVWLHRRWGVMERIGLSDYSSSLFVVFEAVDRVRSIPWSLGSSILPIAFVWLHRRWDVVERIGVADYSTSLSVVVEACDRVRSIPALRLGRRQCPSLSKPLTASPPLRSICRHMAVDCVRSMASSLGS